VRTENRPLRAVRLAGEVTMLPNRSDRALGMMITILGSAAFWVPVIVAVLVIAGRL
jgi:hypothetical protein